MSDLHLISQNKMFGGWHKRYRHQSITTVCDMTFAIYLPPQAETQPVPVMYWLSGLTCNDENFSQKAGAQKLAAELGIALVMPDTSPRGTDVPDDEKQSYDFGHGAGFYVNATQPPWNVHYHMYDYVVSELPKLIETHFPVTDKKAISGHSMGGHGALTIAIKNSAAYTSVSAFSPISSPMHCPWGEKALGHYIGKDHTKWREYDTCELIKYCKPTLPILIDQGGADDFLTEQLRPELLEKAVLESGVSLQLNIHPGYDHSYFFIASFIEQHLRFHWNYLLPK